LLGLALWIGAGLTVSAVLCILLGLFAGGWGPPMPVFFAFIGIVGGTGIWMVRYQDVTAGEP
jgi:hypothetical protein